MANVTPCVKYIDIVVSWCFYFCFFLATTGAVAPHIAGAILTVITAQIISLLSKNVLQNYLYYSQLTEPKKYRTLADTVNKAIRMEKKQMAENEIEENKNNQDNQDNNNNNNNNNKENKENDEELIEIPRHLHELFSIVELWGVQKLFF